MPRGRKRLSQEVHRANGSYRKNPNRENTSEPKLDGLTPEMPDWFGDDETQMWDQLTADLRSLGIMSSDLREILIAYCTSYAGWKLAREEVMKTGGLLTNEKGEPKRHPAAADMHKHRDTMNKLLPEFGLTPASRSRLVSMNVDKDENPFAGLLDKLQSRN